MVRHKTRPVRSLSPDETCSIPTKQEDAHLEAEAEVRGGGGKASPSLSFWAVDWAAGSDEAASPQQQPQGKASKSNGLDRAALTTSKDGSAQSSLASFAPSSSPSSSLAASMPLSMIMSMSKQGSSKSSLMLNESDDESEEEAYSHPLSSVQGMPAFSDLQVTIAKAIVKRSGRRDGAANVEDILDYVTKKWKNLRRKDGSQYSSASTYIRRAVQANLRSTANGIALFKMDSRRDGVYWSVCQTVEEAKSPAVSGALGLARPLLPSAVGYHGSDVGLGEDEFWTQMKEEPTSPSASSASPPPPQAELTKEETQYYEAAKVRMTALQRTVSECIMQSGGSCHFEFILDTVQKKWADIKNEDALPRIANLKKLVGACVARDRGEDSKALFMRDHNAESSGYWKLGLSNPYVKTSGLALDTKEKVIPSVVPSVQGSGTADQGSGSGSRRNVPLTHLQELIIDAIAANGEAADLESIYAFIKEGLTRRDGTPYAADIRRAVQSSLFNNSSQSPIFVKLPETDQNTWGLAARGKALLRERQQKLRMAEEDQLIDDDEDDDEDDDDLRTPSFGQVNGNGSGGHGLGSPNGNSGGAASDRPKKKRKKKNQFSGIQQMIAEVMERNGGSAPFETILNECQKRWRTLRKRDGAPYNADPKRSINASLTKTPAYGQVFERDPHIEGFWRLTPAAQKVWDQLKTGGPVEPAQAAVAPRVMMMPRMNLSALTAARVSPASAEMHAGSRHDDDDGDGDYLVGNGNGNSNSRRLEERRELERERRERRRLRESNEGGLGSSPQAGGKDSSSGFLAASTSTSPTDELAAFAHQSIGAGSFTHSPSGLMREDGSMAMVDEDEMDDYAIDGRRTKKRPRRDEGERDELEGDEDELEYGEGLGEAPKLASMQAMVIRAIRKNGGSSSFKTIYDALCEKVEKDKGLMSAVNWARVHRSNFPSDNNSEEEEEEDQNAVKVFARDEQGNWSVPDLKLCDWVMKHKRKRIKVDKFVPKKKNSRLDE